MKKSFTFNTVAQHDRGGHSRFEKQTVLEVRRKKLFTNSLEYGIMSCMENGVEEMEGRKERRMDRRSWTRRRVLALAKKLNAKIEVGSGHPFEIEAEAPRGHHWAGDPGVHVLVSSVWDDETPADMWEDIGNRMEYGVEKCYDTCEYWNEGS